MALGYEPKLVGSDRVWWPAPHRLQDFAKETIRSCCIPTIQQHEINQLAMLVHCSEQVLPLTADADIGFIDAPGSGAISLRSVLAPP